MAEFAVSLVVEKLTNLLSQQAAYLDGVSQKIVHLRNELRWMRSFLKDADMKKEENDLMQQWVSDIRDVAYETEEVIETYVSRAAAQGAFDFVTKPFYLYKVGREIESIRSRIREISGRRETYGVARNGRGGAEGSAANERLRWWRQPSPHVEEDDIIELVEDTKALLTQLTSMESRRRVVSIIGMGGFLPQEGEETAEGVAEKCLNELIDRCMIQVGRLSSLGRVKTVRRAIRIYEIHHGNKAEPSESISTKSRRHAIHSRYDQYAFLKNFAPHLRSLLFFNREYNVDVERKRMKIGFIEKKLNVIYKNFKLLRVLDMEGVRVVSLPDTVGSLIQLRYLGLRKTNLEEELPLSIGNLQNLQTLDLRYSCFLKRIPNVIWKMVQLRHLLLYTPFDSPDSGHLRMDTLSNLQSLPYIEAGNWIDNGGLANMTSLRQLGIDGLSREQVTSVISTLERLKDIQSLSLLLTEQEMFPTLTGLSCCEHLQKLCFYGKMEKLPDPQEFPPNLVKLKLYNSQLPRDSITKFGRLPNLEMLVLGDGSYNWREMVFVSESFPKLEILRFHLLKELEDWIIEESAMPKLKHLVINRCEKLKRIPDGLKLATTLKELEIVGMPVEHVGNWSWQSPTCRLARGTIRLTEHSSNMLARTFLPVRQVHVNFLEYHCHGFTVL
ncbi:hypothetical protein V6N12_073357 [Hibiscus sabdariffa]|uniref:Rx N-terminal domain-containing protein n=1 Tax=Hibiscus sabdariffa TaxID=183260 RepID=A0ABR1ZV36_9ROSI